MFYNRTKNNKKQGFTVVVDDVQKLVEESRTPLWIPDIKLISILKKEDP